VAVDGVLQFLLDAVEECPAAKPREHIRCSIEQDAFRSLERFCLVNPDEVEILLLSPFYAKALNVFNDHFRRFLIFLLQRYKARHPLWHVGKTCI